MWQLSKSLAAFMSTNHALVWSGIHLCYNKSFRDTFQCETRVLRNQNMGNCHNTCLNTWNLNKVNKKVGHLATLSYRPHTVQLPEFPECYSLFCFSSYLNVGRLCETLLPLWQKEEFFLKGNLTIDMSNFTEIETPTQFTSYRHRHVYKRHVHSLIL